MNFSPEKAFLSPERSCPYLTSENCTLKHYIDPIDTNTYQKLLFHGWRRFGRHFFAPVCSNCFKCKSIRVLVNEFTLSRSFRRVLSAGKDIDLIIRKPTITNGHMNLYHKYHDFKTKTKGWDDEANTNINDYYIAFVDGAYEYGFEFAYYLNDKLISVALVDMLPMEYSAVYCYYDPDLAHLSLGTFSILKQIEIAQENKIPYLYLGYLVDGNRTMQYKSRYKPFETLNTRSSIEDGATWIRGDCEED